jgi:hypothetical protein
MPANDFVLCIDEASGLLADKGGEPLFTPDGQKSPTREKAISFVSGVQKHVALEKMFCDVLIQFDLLSPLKIQFRRNEKKVKIEGLFLVDEKKLGVLSDADFLFVRAAGILPLAYAHFFLWESFRC